MNKISLELQTVSKNKAGIGNYTYNIAKCLAKNNKYKYIGELFNILGKNDTDIVKELNIEIKENKWFWYKLYDRYREYVNIKYNKIIGTNSDIYTFFNFHIPKNIDGKVIVVIHDMIPILFPEVCTYAKKKEEYIPSVENSDVIVTVSESAKRDIISLFDVDPKKIRIISPGIYLEECRKKYSHEELENTRKKYSLPNKFLMYLGTLEPRKGVDKLILAFNMLKEKGNSDIKLVIAGGKGWMYNKIFDLYENSKYKKDIIFTGYVDEKDKIKLYKLAEAFVFPTLYEGFGMPVLESMASGTPVVASNNSSIPEVTGDAGILINRDSVEDLCEGMEKILGDEELRKELIKRGIKQSEKFKWEDSAKKYEDIYEELLKGR
ncbi:glycosyltransferase family 4 protein [Fusobacterium sp. MFO224]|uniref:glycosyltransferase family 4 protein n=1 Tax=Fusobacterium sp. MFO224 TaxID=3378070 RepID=UPI00385543DD